MAGKTNISVTGLITSPGFQRAKTLTQQILEKQHEEDDFSSLMQMNALLEWEWRLTLKEKTLELDDDLWSYQQQDKPIVCINEELVDPDVLVKIASENYGIISEFSEECYAKMGEEERKQLLQATGHSFVFMNFRKKKEKERNPCHIVIELFSDLLPKTCENFKALCIGDKTIDGHRIAYKGTQIHRVVPNGWIQGGDILGSNGDNGYSIYGKEFDDENYIIKHNKCGIVGMANKGPHTNASQFYITLKEIPWMDCKYVAFGQVIEGMAVLEAIENMETYNQRPSIDVTITDCGLLENLNPSPSTTELHEFYS